MTVWTVMLKTEDGIDFRTVRADAVAWSEDHQFLEFTDIKAGIDGLMMLESFLRDTKAGSLQPQEVARRVHKLIRTFGGMDVASFDRQAVLGYFKGRRVPPNLHVGLEQ